MGEFIGELKERLYTKYFDTHNSIRLVLFNIIILCTVIFSVPSIIIMAIAGFGLIQIPLIVLTAIIAMVCFILANRYGRINLASSIIIIVVTLIIFPILFFLGGAIYGGMSMYFMLGIVFLFMLVKGKPFAVLLTLQIIVYSLCFYIAYTYPGFITPIGSRADMFFDIHQALVIVALGLGIINKFQTATYEKVLRDINEKNDALRESEQRAHQANMAKREFLASMSHEIRTPINAIIGMNEVIMRETEEKEIAEYAAVVSNSANSLLSIINDILDYSNIDAGKIRIKNERYELKTLLSDCYYMINDRVEEKNLELIIDCDRELPAVYNGDIVRIRQVITNLLTNAVKYTDSGRIQLEVSGISTGHGMTLVFAVSDTGIGMRPEDVADIYTMFKRLDTQRNQAVAGTGLGMSIVKQLLDLMNGEIEIESEYGIGSKFIVKIPQYVVSSGPIGDVNFDNTAPVVSESIYKPIVVAPKAKVLVVDDVNVNLVVFKNLVKKTGINTDTASGGKQCLEMIKNTKYDIIFMDHMMPEMNGIETYEHIKADKTHMNTDTPVVMLTANATTGMEEEYIARGFDGYISKPIDTQKLERILKKYIENNGEEEIREEVKMAEMNNAAVDIDIEAGINNCGGDAEFYDEVIQSFEEEDKRGELISSYAAEDWELYTIVVHSLKGTLRLFGAMGAGKLAEALQFAGEKSDIDYIRANHDAFIKAMDESMEYIKNNK